MPINKLPALTKLRETKSCTVWRADFPSNARKVSVSYRVWTYPKSELIALETWVSRRAITGKNVEAAIRKVLEEQGVALRGAQ